MLTSTSYDVVMMWLHYKEHIRISKHRAGNESMADTSSVIQLIVITCHQV